MPSAQTNQDPQHTSTIPLPSSPNHRRASLKVLSRNIEKVVLGNLSFPTWYYSPYPDSIILSSHNHNSNSDPVADAKTSNGEPASYFEANIGSRPTVHQGHKPKAGTTAINGASEARPVQRVGAIANNAPIASGPNLGVDHNQVLELKRRPPLLDTLHVCPYCFRYSPSFSDYAMHIEVHASAERSSTAAPTVSRPTSMKFEPRPDSESRSESESDEDVNDETNGQTKGPRRIVKKPKRMSARRPVPKSATKVYSHAGYTVWDVDGEVEKLYCQNLSLFGKLFLEQKSVFFDTSGFHYFVLTYCSPAQVRSSTTATAAAQRSKKMFSGKRDTQTKKSRKDTFRNQQTEAGDPKDPDENTAEGRNLRTGRKRRSSGGASAAGAVAHGENINISTPLPSSASTTASEFVLKHQVLGFFSKENLSWDANNLACILVFPPYQHRNLGQLLMAVSYKLSGWEWEGSVIGGPEKPLSAMGKKSYLRFWSERIVRYLMGQATDAEGRRVFEVSSDADSAITKKRKTGKNRSPPTETLTIKELGDRTGMLGEDVVAALIEMGIAEEVPPKRRMKRESDSSNAPHSSTADESEEDYTTTMMVRRSKVLEWAEQRGVDLISPVKEEGFLGEWALSEASESDEATQEDHDHADR